MEWQHRPDGAPPTWAADELRQRLMGVDLELELDDGSRTRGRLDDVTPAGSAISLDLGGTFRSVDTRRIVAYRLVLEPIDHSDELRGL